MWLLPDGHIGIFGASQVVVYGLPTHATADDLPQPLLSSDLSRRNVVEQAKLGSLILIGPKCIVGRCTAAAMASASPESFPVGLHERTKEPRE